MLANDLADTIVAVSRKFNVDFLLIVEIMRQESGFRSNVTSPKGAAGLMQFMPATARQYGVTNPYDPEQAITGACIYLRYLMDRFGRLDLALAAYNCGENRVERNGRRIPPISETVNYVGSIMRAYNRARTLRVNYKNGNGGNRLRSREQLERDFNKLDNEVIQLFQRR